MVPFNRTNMELKPLERYINVRDRSTFNRTNMELKLVLKIRVICSTKTFNRTNMELKRAHGFVEKFKFKPF